VVARDHPVAVLDQPGPDVPPAVGALREAVQQQHQLAVRLPEGKSVEFQVPDLDLHDLDRSVCR